MTTLPTPLRGWRLRHRTRRLYWLSRLHLGLDTLPDPLRQAFLAAIRREQPPEFGHIEAIRQQLLTSKEVITQLDYGAGTEKDAPQTPTAGVERTDTLGVITARSSKSPFWCRVLFHLVRELKPVRCLEMGTAVGISAAYQGAALLLNKRGTLTTIEGAPALSEAAWDQVLRRLGLVSRSPDLGDIVELYTGRFQDVLPSVLPDLTPLDYAFIDGHHDEQATVLYFHTLLPACLPGAVLVFDDIRWSPGMQRAWDLIVQHPRVAQAVDAGPVGFCMLGDGTRPRQPAPIVRAPLDVFDG